MTYKLPLTVITDTSPHVARVERLIRAIWRWIPKEDRSLMLKAISKYPHKKLYVEIQCDWDRSLDSNGAIYMNRGIIVLDGGYLNAADDESVSSLIAHEFGHLRGHADPNGPDRTEETANRFQQEIWGYPEGQVISKCNVSRAIEDIIHRERIPGQIFWLREWNLFVWLPPNELLTLGEPTYYWLETHPFHAAECLLIGLIDHPLLIERKRKASIITRSARFKNLKESLDYIAATYMPEEV